MKILEYKLEFFCLLLFTLCSSLWVLSLKEDRSTSAQLSPLLALEKVIPQHEVQLLNANFSDQQHYDQLAQLQSEVEALVSDVNVSDTSAELFQDYKETSLSYIQLTSMLKTSQRFVSDLSELESAQLKEVIDNIRLGLFSYITTPNKTDKAALIAQLESIEVDSKLQTNWRHLQLVKLHGLFVLDNYELTAEHRQKLIDMPITEAIIEEQAPLKQQIKQSNIMQLACIFGTILGLVLLFVVVIKRHESELKKTSDKHKAFATNILDMLDSHPEKGQANPTPTEDKPMRILNPK